MKTSLNIEDSLFKAAQQEAVRLGKSLSEMISYWARVGREALKKKKSPTKSFEAIDLGGPAMIDFNSRRDWIDLLDR